MSQKHDPNGVYVDTGLLRDHVSKLREQKKTAMRLRENLVAMRDSGDPTEFGQYRSVLRDVDQLIDYLSGMVKVLSNATDEATQLSRVLGSHIQDQTDETRHVSTRSYML